MTDGAIEADELEGATGRARTIGDSEKLGPTDIEAAAAPVPIPGERLKAGTVANL